MKNKKLFLFCLFGILLILPIVYAVDNSQDVVYNKSAIIQHSDLSANLSQDNSSYRYRGAVTTGGTPEFSSVAQVGEGAARFDGTSASYTFSNINNIYTTMTKNFGFCFWTDVNSTSGTITPIIQDDDADTLAPVGAWDILVISGTTRFRLDVGNDAGNTAGRFTYINASYFNDNTWKWICGVFNLTGTTMNTYLIINNTNVGGITTTITNPANTNNIAIGFDGGAIFYKAKLDELMVFNYSPTFGGPDTDLSRYWKNGTGNLNQLKAPATPADTTFPIINASLNFTAPRINDVINFSANITDETGLTFGNITINFTTGTIKMNFSLSGTSGRIYNVSQIPANCVGGCVINYTAYATDTSNNVRQNSTLVTIIDNVPPKVNASFDIFSKTLKASDTANYSANMTDETGLLSANITYNASGFVTKINFTISGSSARVFNISIMPSAGSVINFTTYVTDTSNNVNQNSTLITLPVMLDNFTFLNSTFEKDDNSCPDLFTILEPAEPYLFDSNSLTIPTVECAGADASSGEDARFIVMFRINLTSDWAGYIQFVDVYNYTCNDDTCEGSYNISIFSEINQQWTTMGYQNMKPTDSVTANFGSTKEKIFANFSTSSPANYLDANNSIKIRYQTSMNKFPLNAIDIWYIAYNNLPYYNLTGPTDFTPSGITLINLTSEGGLGQIIFQDGVVNNKLAGAAKTNRTTPTFFILTDELATCGVIDGNKDFNWTDINKTNSNFDSGAPALTHTITLNTSNASNVGLRNFSIGCKDNVGNENRSSTSSNFTVNITDGVPPSLVLGKIGAFFVTDINATNILINWSASDLIDSSFNVSVRINGTSVYENISFINKSDGRIFVSRDFGDYVFNITLNDSFNNANTTGGVFSVRNDTIPPNVTIFGPASGSVFVIGINNTNVQFNWRAVDNMNNTLKNCSIFINNLLMSSKLNYANGTNFTTNITLTTTGASNWSANCTDWYQNTNGSNVNSFNLIALDINYTLNQPLNNSLQVAGNTVFNFTVNFTENIDKCFLYINGKANQSNVSRIINKVKYNMTANLTNNDYNWTVGCDVSNSSDIFSLSISNPPTVAFTNPTPANNTIISNSSILINVTTTGKILNYTLDWNGTNQSVNFNTTLNLVINKTSLFDLTTYRYRIYVNDSNNNKNDTGDRYVSININGILVQTTTGINFTFKPSVEEITSFMPNETITWAGNDSFRQLVKSRVVNSSIQVYNNGTKINAGNNWTANAQAQIKIINSSGIEWVTSSINVSYVFFSGNFTIRTQNISCSGQNDTVGCINVSRIFEKNLNFSLMFNITSDPPSQRIIEDFSTNAKNWSVSQQRSNNTINKTIVNSSIVCGEMQSVNSIGLIEYSFNNTLEMAYINSSNQSVLTNLTFNCTSPSYFIRVLNGSQKNVSGFNSFNFSWKGDNTTNTFQISLIDEAGTKVSSPTLTLSNPSSFNYSGFSLGTLKNISMINLSISNVSGTRGLSGFLMENLRLINTTSNQSERIKMKAGCTSNYANSTLLVPNVLTNMCIIGTLSNYIWVYQDINLTKKGISWKLQYNASIIN